MFVDVDERTSSCLDLPGGETFARGGDFSDELQKKATLTYFGVAAKA